jgi:hypothetical protein
MLDRMDGSETLSQATDIFKYIDRNFERWNCDVVGHADPGNSGSSL